MRKKPESEEDEFSVDEPEEFQESDDDWTPASSEAKGRRQPLRGSRKRSVVHTTDSSDDDDDDESDDDENDDEGSGQKGKRSRGRMKKVKKSTPKTSSPKPASTLSCVPVQAEATSTTPNTVVEKEFSSGAFIVLKADLEKEEYPPIWKIDGKALLQKYMPEKVEGKTLYKNTSTYSGWSISNKEQYYPAPINFKTQNRKEIIVELLKNEIPVSAGENEDSE